MPSKIVFVTPELFPFDVGGIGRVIANILETASAVERKQMAVAHLTGNLTPDRFRSVYPDVEWIDADPDRYLETDEYGNRYPPLRAYQDGRLHAESVRVMQILKRYEELNGPPSYIEFADWGGAAFASIQEKKLGIAFQTTCLAVRLHSTGSMIGAVESHPTNEHSLALYDIERTSLADTDMIVAQLPGVAQEVLRFFDLDAAEWKPRLRIHAPPVLLDNVSPATETVRVTLDTPIVFSSKIQGFKRPETFVRACGGFLRDQPAYRGKIILLAHAFDSAYLESVKTLIAPEIAHRFLFVPSAGGVERQKIISRSVCVFSTAFESFCLAAYEASMSGARCIVNSSNVAFNDSSPWVDGQNCEKFDGSAIDLHRVLHRVFESEPVPLQPIQAPCDPMPWLALPSSDQRIDAHPTVSILITHCNSSVHLEETLNSVLASDYPNIEIVIVDDASTDPVSQAFIECLAAVADERFRVIKLEQSVGEDAARNAALQAASGEFTLRLDAHGVILPHFISEAVRALVHNRTHDFVIPQTAYFDAEHPPLSASAPMEFSISADEARASSLHRNYFSAGATFARKTVLEMLPYNETRADKEDAEPGVGAVGGGHRFIVTNTIQFFCRHNSTSVETATRRAERLSQYRDVLRSRQLPLGKMQISLYAVDAGIPIEEAAESPPDEALRAQLQFYENSRVVFAALAVANRLRKSAPWVLSVGRFAAKLMWRTWQRLKAIKMLMQKG